MTKWVIVAAFVLGLLALFPLSVRIADPFFTRPYEERFEVPVLLVFPERVEVRWINNLAEVSPAPCGASYTFAIQPDREQWVEQQVRRLPPPRPGSGWRVRVHQLEDGTQRVELEAYRDGFTGLIYDARKTSITPVAYRAAGPGAAFIYLLIDIGLSCALSMLGGIAMHFARRQRSRT